MPSNTFRSVGYFERGEGSNNFRKNEPRQSGRAKQFKSNQMNHKLNVNGKNENVEDDGRRNENREMNNVGNRQTQAVANMPTPMSYALVVGNNNEVRNKFEFKNMVYKDKRSDVYIKRGLWWYRPKELCLEDFMDYFTEKYGKGCIDMIYQVAYKKIEAYAKDEATALMIAEEKVVIGNVETKINLINIGPLKICIKNIMPWLTISEIKEALQSYGEVIEETVEYMPVKRNIDKNGLVASGQVVLYLNKKNQMQMPMYITPKINSDYHRWYMAPMSVQCYNCGEFGHWLRFCGREHDQQKIEQRKTAGRTEGKKDDDSKYVEGDDENGEQNGMMSGENDGEKGKEEMNEEQIGKQEDEVVKEQLNGREPLPEKVKKGEDMDDEALQDYKTVVDGDQRDEVMRKCDELEKAINNKDLIDLEEESAPITQNSNVSQKVKKAKMKKSNPQSKRNSKRRKVEQKSQNVNKVENDKIDKTQPDVIQDEPMEEEVQNEDENEVFIDSSETSDGDEEDRTVGDVIQSITGVNDLFEQEGGQRKSKGCEEQKKEMVDGQSDHKQYNEIVQILNSAIKNRRLSRKQYPAKDLENYDVNQMEIFKEKYEDILQQNDLAKEMNTFIQRVIEYKKSKTKMSPLQNFFENFSNKEVTEAGSQRLRRESRSGRGPSISVMDEINDGNIPQCTLVMTQLIKRVDQSKKTMDEMGNIEKEFFQDFDLEEAVHLMRDNVEFLVKHNRLRSVFNFVTKACQHSKKNVVSEELEREIGQAIKQNYG